jgi:ABC-type sugar transport system permease subunit
VGIVSATSEALILTGGGPAGATRTVGLYAYQTAFSGPMNLGYGAAINLALGILGILISFTVFRSMKAVET